MKMIIRADDVGYSKAFNMGSFEARERGVATVAELMMDTPGTLEALERLQDFPWISIGWHCHFFGSPVLDPARVPSLVAEHNGKICFRKDIREAKDISYAEAVMELRAELDLCIKMLGRTPDTNTSRRSSVIYDAVKQVCDEYGIVQNFLKRQDRSQGTLEGLEVDPKWAGRHIYMMDSAVARPDSIVYSDSFDDLKKYDPAAYYIEDQCRLSDFSEDDIVVQAWHPGYQDFYIYNLDVENFPGVYARNFMVTRLKDVEALCSDRLKSWIKKKNIELVNFRDALYGTREYQNHLKSIGSDLAVG
jgi:predicted glycoside hydrolase/deacetylase ChbG (UPF0249 family)